MDSASRIDAAIEVEVFGLAAKLRAAREARVGLTQEALARQLRVSAVALRQWERAIEVPTVAHLMSWCKQLDVRLRVVDPAGRVLCPRLERRAGEGWGAREARRIAVALRGQRIGYGRSQEWLAEHLHMTRRSANRWENARSTPRLFDLARWAALLGCGFALERDG